MKKMISCLLLLSLLFPLVSCGNESVGTTASSETETTASTTETVASSSETTESTETTETTNPGPVVPEIDPTTVFDETNIVFSFGAISDTHVDGANTIPAQKFKSALEQLKARAALHDADGIDAICVAGDLIDTGYNGNYNETNFFKNIYESVFDPTVTPLIYTIGNHDPKGWWTANSASEAQQISKLLGDSYFKADLDNEMRKSEECRHCKVGPYHFLCITPCTQDPVTYTGAAKEWLDKTLAELTAENPGQYVFVVTHPMIHNTVYGSDLGTYWYTDDLTDILSKYPQVVTFGGHLHFPLNDPRSVMQTAFTSFGCGSVRYMAIEAGNYEDMAGNTTMNDKDEFSQGLLIQIDGNGNLRATRMDFYHEDTIDEPWEVSHPVADGSHLMKYTMDRGSEENNKAPKMTDLSVSVGDGTGSSRPVTVTFAAAEDDEFAHHYELILNVKGHEIVKKILADFYRQPKSGDMKKVWIKSLGKLSFGSYSVSVT
ncbi:MAG: metallophosphoesterase, partial [Ruminococcus sp.]|nr:metallophosphoesterase [Candidatus Apopatosoma intestinale]